MALRLGSRLCILRNLTTQSSRRSGGSRMIHRSLSAVIISKNEEDRIGSCLRALAGWAGEIIVVDCGSEDRTVEICRRYTPDVIETYWRGFGRQKQFALEAAHGEWVLSVDADEVVSEGLREEIDEILTGDPPRETAFRIQRECHVFGKTLRYGDCGSAPIRLFRRELGRFSDDKVHERVLIDGRIGRFRSKLGHYSIRDMDHALDKTREYARLWALQRYRLGRRVNLWQCWLHTAIAPFSELIFRRGILDGRHGIVMALLQAQYTFDKYVSLWSMGLGDEARSASWLRYMLPPHPVRLLELRLGLPGSVSPETEGAADIDA